MLRSRRLETLRYVWAIQQSFAHVPVSRHLLCVFFWWVGGWPNNSDVTILHFKPGFRKLHALSCLENTQQQNQKKNTEGLMTSEGASHRVRGLLVYPFKIRTYLKVGLTRLKGWKLSPRMQKTVVESRSGKVGQSNTTLVFYFLRISLFAFCLLGGLWKFLSEIV